MAVVLALCSAATYGIGDFCGGMAARRVPATTVLLWSHLLGFVLFVLAAPFVAGSATGGDLLIGAVGGLCGAIGVGLLYKGLAIGPMSVVAPITALLSATVPVTAGLLQGERPSTGVAVGMVAALVAIVLVSAEGGGSLRPSDLRGVTFALGAGLGFGLFFVTLSHVGEDSGIWPLVAARGASASAVGALALLGRVSRTPPVAGARLFTAAAGTLDAFANVCYLLATREGLLTVVSVLTALYPVGTVILARLILKERFARVQRVGMALALPAAILMAT
ncbi:MAG: DMT family transporter [Acidimicrobiales bacterium]